ncbi:hypothetical protein IAT38_001415 [Cryptococcus sp. DSM 104549]
MIYVFGFLILLLLIVVVWLVRFIIVRVNQCRKRDQPHVSMREDARAQFREVTDTFIYGGRGRQDPYAEPYVPYHRRSMGDQGPVVRLMSESQASLPAYGAHSLPVPPERAYEAQHVRIRPDQTTAVLTGMPEAPPPKYSAVTGNSSVV